MTSRRSRSIVPCARRVRQVLNALVLATALPATAGIEIMGEVTPNPIPASGTVTGVLAIGPASFGSVKVNGGSLLTTDTLWLANATVVNTGNGLLTVEGVGSKTLVTWADRQNLDIGGSGTGTVSLLDGGSMVYGDGSADCVLNCQFNVTTGAGSTGNLLVRGAGSRLDTVGRAMVGWSIVIRPDPGTGETRTYGEIGGTSNGIATVDQGGRASSSALVIGSPGFSNAQTGTETSIGRVVVDGISSAWDVVRDAAQNGARALLSMGTGRNADGTLIVRNGGVVRVDGGSAAGEFGGLNAAAGASGSLVPGAKASIDVAGAGSRLTFGGGVGFLNLGRGIGADGRIEVNDGGYLGSADSTAQRGLTFITVGGGGSSASLTVDGVGSLVLLSGRNSDTNSLPGTAFGAGASMTIGRSDAGASGTGTVNVLGGGRVTIDNSALAIVPTNGQTGITVGRDAGSVGSLMVSGAGSRVDISTGNGASIYSAVGRDGATGSMVVSAGGKVAFSSGGTSVPTVGTGVYAPGDLTLLDIGRNFLAAPTSSIGTVSVSGAGSELIQGGTRDRLINVGRGNGGNGTLNITAGGRVSTFAVLVGTDVGAVGTLNMNSGRLETSGVAAGGPAPGNGGGLRVGHAGGTGTANLDNGSVVSLTSTGGAPSLSVGGSPTAIGGTGTVNITGASSVLIDGPDAIAGIGRTASATVAGIGTLNLSGAGSNLAVTGSNGAVVLGAASNTIGTVNVGAGSTLSASSLVGIAHDGAADTGGIGKLSVNGTVSAPDIINGTGGVICGNGTLVGSVTNFGTISPGCSPGRLTIDGAFDNRGGRIVLEVQARAGGGFDVDELVFLDPTRLTIGDSAIEFLFLGGTDPTAFLGSGAFNLGTFFKEMDSNGEIVDLAASHFDLFADAMFDASAEGFVVSAFSFDPTTGAFSITASAIPLPSTLLLTLAALAAMRLPRRQPAPA